MTAQSFNWKPAKNLPPISRKSNERPSQDAMFKSDFKGIDTVAFEKRHAALNAKPAKATKAKAGPCGHCQRCGRVLKHSVIMGGHMLGPVCARKERHGEGKQGDMWCKSDFEIVRQDDGRVFLVDLDLGNMSVTNDAENVCREVWGRYGTRASTIVYRGSDGVWMQLQHERGVFTGYSPWNDATPNEG